MVKLVRKKQPNFHVKEKILSLIDSWQEAFGANSRYPQYYAAYLELLHAGAVFPRGMRRLPCIHSSNNLCLIPNASLLHSLMLPVPSRNVKCIRSGNKEGLKQEVIVDLVQQCRVYKQRVVHLVNSTMSLHLLPIGLRDESLLCQGLALNDDLLRVLAQHEEIASGTFQADKPKPEVDTGDSSKQSEGRPTSSTSSQTFNQSSLPVPPTTGSTPTAAVDPKMDLLSGDDYNFAKADDSLAVVPVGEPEQTTPASSQQMALVLFDMFPDDNNTPAVNTLFRFGWTTISFDSSNQQSFLTSQTQQQNFHEIGNAPNMGSPQHEQPFAQGTGPAWNIQQQLHLTHICSLPPPWEAQAAERSLVAVPQYSQSMVTQVVVTPPFGPQQMVSDQVVGVYIQPVTTGHLLAINNQQQQAVQGNQFGFHPQGVQGAPYNIGMIPQQMPVPQIMAPMYSPQHMYGGQQMAPHGGHGQQWYLDQQMYGLHRR
ncbi:Detected protein of unknown function [Hibiscus syriacus]|uniref:VHS domain-containing protein n=1 Tax=Hibiscus syriacus TaxID=106335 RepID=A0A6A3A2L8_HIBSY|nr:Detected protein of unknown function [Hibiscus syriacus]